MNAPHAMRTRRGLLALLVAALLGGAGAGALAPQLLEPSAVIAQDQPQQRAALPTEGIEAAEALSSAFARVAEHIQPSVVSIESVQTVTSRMPSGMEEFFRRFGMPERENPQREFQRRGLGSGFIVSHDGYIMTNNHVVEDAEMVTVVLADDTEYEADVVGTDPQTDLALLKIEASGLTPVIFGDSENLRVGQWVIAAGNPFGLSSTITAGIVSATGRSNMRLAAYEDFIQTDAAINPGNSGGPLVNLAGEVVGVNTAIFSRSGGNMGVGFAIPSAMAQHVLDSLIDNGRVERGWLGVIIQDLTPGLAGSYGYDSTDGALVTEVMPDSPAAEAGFKSGDIITRVGDEKVTNMDELRLTVSQMAPGTEVDVQVFRDGKQRTINLELGELPSDPTQVTQRPSPVETELGMAVRNLTPEIAGQLGLEDVDSGVVVTDVDATGAAARAGIEPGMVILKVQDQSVRNVQQFRTAIAQADLADGVRLVVQAGPVKRFIFLQTDE